MSLEGYVIPAGQLTCPDPSSFSNHHIVQTVAFHVDARLDFKTSTIATVFDLQAVVRADDAVVLSLDMKEFTIDSVQCIDGLRGGVIDEAVRYQEGEQDKFGQGQRLLVGLPQSKQWKAGDEVFFRFTYTTSPNASAAQWLTAEQVGTEDKPYFYTQCQSTHARSLIPIQDACASKIVFTANLTYPSNLTGIMSAYPDGEKVDNGDGTVTSKFKLPNRIPPYLFAICVGDLVHHPIGKRTALYAMSKDIDVAKREYAELEDILNAVESIAGPYKWAGVYSINSMPSSFPFGGMEGVVTFNSGTLLPLPRHTINKNCRECQQIAEERAMGLAASVSIHEAVHSWSGNSTTNKDWGCFFLNEGLTMTIQLATQRKLYGPGEEGLQLLINWEDLCDSCELFAKDGNENATKLVPDLTITSAEDIFSSVPYHKGEALFYYLEEIMGGAERFQAFLKVYFEVFKFSNLDHNDFKKFYLDYCQEHGFVQRLSEIDWDTWFYAPGLPVFRPKADLSLAAAAFRAAELLLPTQSAGVDAATAALVAEPQDVASFSPSQQNVFLDTVLKRFDEQYDALPTKEQKVAFQMFVRNFTLSHLNANVNFAASRNCELLSRYLYLAIRANVDKDQVVSQQGGADVTLGETIQWFSQIAGRMKFARPLYRTLLQSSQFNMLTGQFFEAAKKGYHTIASGLVAKDIQAAQANPNLRW